MSGKAMQLSKDRADEVLRRLAERNPQLQRGRLESVGKGWDEPVAPPGSEENRRVEVQWFLVE
jgi:NitT/TauT family transport system substrate-binding protein